MDSCVLWSMMGTKVYKKCAQVKELEQQRDDLRDACEAALPFVVAHDITHKTISGIGLQLQAAIAQSKQS